MKELLAIGNCMGAPAYFESLVDKVTVLPIRGDTPGIIEERATKDTIVMFGGGEDIHPFLYTPRVSKYSMVGEDLSLRDRVEADCAQAAAKNRAFSLGICRGAQLLGACAGQTLYQHVTGHHSSHKIIPVTSKLPVKFIKDIQTTSVHHQMVRFTGEEYKRSVLFATSAPISRHYVIDDNNVLPPGADGYQGDPEIFYIKRSKYFGIQGHPEFTGMDSEFAVFCRELVQHYFEESRK